MAPVLESHNSICLIFFLEETEFSRLGLLGGGRSGHMTRRMGPVDLK